MTDRIDRPFAIGLAITMAAAVIYYFSAREFDSGRDDFFYLSDAFLKGRTWLSYALGNNDVITIDGRPYVPFAPFPAILFMPLVAITGPVGADQLGAEINAVLAASAVGLCWVLMGRIGVENLLQRTSLVVLFGFTTSLYWVVIRGGVWHTAQIVATVLTMICLVELWGRQRAPLIGLVAGAAFLTRAPLAFVVPFYMLLLDPASRQTFSHARDRLGQALERWPVRDWLSLGLGTVPAIAFFFWYNAVRFGDPLESGYALAALPEWLEARRQMGLFSLAHVGWNIDLMVLKLPSRRAEFPWFQPDNVGNSVLFTSPTLFMAVLAPWRDRRSWILLGAAVAVLIPTLLYYGGGWVQYGYRYFLDSVPFLVALAGMGVARRGLHWLWLPVLAWGVVIGALGVYWVDKL